MTVYMYMNQSKPAAQTIACEAASILSSDGISVLVDDSAPTMPRIQARTLPVAQAQKECDIVLCIGGDGTIMRAARNAVTHRKPVLGINIGQLGFLAIIERNELDQLHRVAKKDYSVVSQHMIYAEIEGKRKKQKLAFNDIVVTSLKPAGVISLEVFCDDVPFCNYRGDGIIFSTSIGSTAYSMSAGGPIVDTRLGALVVTQICPHIGRMPSLVIAGERVLRVVPCGPKHQSISSALSRGVT